MSEINGTEQTGYIGNMAPGEKKKFEIKIPQGARMGDGIKIEFGWICGGCNRSRKKSFSIELGAAPPKFSFKCDCDSVFYRLKKLFVKQQ